MEARNHFKNLVSSQSRMSKRITVLIFLFLPLTLNAQFKTWSNWINFGINYSTINTHDNKLFEITPKYGINIGLEYPYSFNKHFFFVPEVCIAQKGAKLVGIPPNGTKYFDEYNMKLTYIEMPVSLKTSIDYKNVACFLKTGFYFGINLWTNSVNKGGSTVGVIKSPNFNKPFDYGIQGGIGFELYEKFNIQSRLYYGFYDSGGGKRFGDVYYLNFAINFSVGYKFK